MTGQVTLCRYDRPLFRFIMYSLLNSGIQTCTPLESEGPYDPALTKLANDFYIYRLRMEPSTYETFEITLFYLSEKYDCIVQLYAAHEETSRHRSMTRCGLHGLDSLAFETVVQNPKLFISLCQATVLVEVNLCHHQIITGGSHRPQQGQGGKGTTPNQQRGRGTLLQWRFLGC